MGAKLRTHPLKSSSACLTGKNYMFIPFSQSSCIVLALGMAIIGKNMGATALG
jgi:hypothetical protein